MMRSTGLSAAMGLALIAGGCGFDGGRVIDGDFITSVDDTSELSVKVKRALKKAPRTAIYSFNVSTVSDDTVRLSGFVDNEGLLREAERVAEQVPGVRFVFNDLAVR